MGHLLFRSWYLTGLERQVVLLGKMITYQTLAQSTQGEVLDVFNAAFADYLIPFHLSPEQFLARMKSDSLRLPISVGAFDQKRLVGFILHGEKPNDNQRVVYNGGTGVLPSHRGQGITAAMYAYILPVLKFQGVKKVQLEVITNNLPALKTYERVGFKKGRELDCYKGIVSLHNPQDRNSIRKLDTYAWPELQRFWDIRPSWQNDVQAIENLGDTLISYGYYHHDILLGYLVFNPRLRRIMQMAVHPAYRRHSIGRQLVQHLVINQGPELSVINVDRRSLIVREFLNTLGLNQFLEMYEMELQIDG